MAFCESTLATIQGSLEEAISDLRRTLIEGLSEGEAGRELSRRVADIFGDPMRAARIAETEASRAVHQGQLMQAREVNEAGGIEVRSKSWLSSSDACKGCLRLAAMGEIPLDRPFWVNPKGGPYAVVDAPPLHPS